MTESAQNKFKPIRLIEDQPIDDLENDYLGLRPWAQMIAGSAVGTKGPFTIGVHGEWGYGKTTLLRLARQLVDENDEDAVTVWFNAWQFEREEHPLFSLIAAISDEIEKKTDKNPSLEGLKKVGASLRALTRGMKFTGEVGMPFMGKVGVEFDAEKALKAEELIGMQANPLQGEMIYHSAFSMLEEVTRGKNEGTKAKIVVFVDDLDRCNPDKAVFLLESIKLILAQPGFVFVLAVDRRVIEGYLEKRYLEYCGKNDINLGRFYLEKIIQLPINIPSHRSRFDEFVKRTVGELAEYYIGEKLTEALEGVQNVLAIGARNNPRRLIRLVNNFILDCSLWPLIPRDGSEYEKYQELSTDVAAALVFNRIFQPLLGDSYDNLIYDQDLCDDILAERLTEYTDVANDRPDVIETHNKSWLQSEIISSQISIVRSLESRSELLQALKNNGEVWLREINLRKAVYEFAQAQRGEDGLANLPKVIADAIRIHLKLLSDEPILDERLVDVKKLDLKNSSIENAQLVHLNVLKGLHSLNLAGTQITDVGLTHLKNLQGLKSLDLENTKITDAGLEHLSCMHDLKNLFLDYTKVTDAGLEHLKNMQSLFLEGTQITDAGLMCLKKMHNLQSLNLACTKITDAGLACLKNMHGLQYLYLWDTKVSDAGLVHLKNMHGLQHLDLEGTNITDVGLMDLNNMKSLQNLDISRTQVTDVGVYELKKQIPGLEIVNG